MSSADDFVIIALLFSFVKTFFIKIYKFILFTLSLPAERPEKQNNDDNHINSII